MSSEHLIYSFGQVSFRGRKSCPNRFWTKLVSDSKLESSSRDQILYKVILRSSFASRDLERHC